MNQRGITSVAELARRTGTTPLALSNLIKGKTKAIEFRILNNLCRVLACTPGDLFSYDPDLKERVYVHDADQR